MVWESKEVPMTPRNKLCDFQRLCQAFRHPTGKPSPTRTILFNFPCGRNDLKSVLMGRKWQGERVIWEARGDGAISTVLATQAENLSSDLLHRCKGLYRCVKTCTTVTPALREQTWEDSWSLLSNRTNLKVSLGFNERPYLKNQTVGQLKETPDIDL